MQTMQTGVEGRHAARDSEDPGERRSWRQLSLEQKEIALRFGTTEAGLVGSRVGTSVVRLRAEWELALHRLGAVGPVTALTSNDHATIQSLVVYRDIATKGQAAQVSDGDTDLCLFLSKWHSGFALTEAGAQGAERSLQFFDAGGAAVHKVFLRENSDVRAFDDLVARQASENQSAAATIAGEPRDRPPPPALAGEPVDESLPVIHGIDVEQAPVLVGPMSSQQVARASFRHVLESAVRSEVSLLIMVGNHGAIQIHGGSVPRLQQVEGALTLVDTNFNLHVDERGVASAWVVRKATPDGVVTSLELYDRRGEMIVYLARI